MKLEKQKVSPCSADDLLAMLKWIVSFRCPEDGKVLIDSEPIKQAERLIVNYEKQRMKKS